LNRFLIVESRLPRSASRRTRRIDPPDNVIGWAKTCASANAGGNTTDQGSEFPPVPVEMEITSSAYRLLDEYEAILIDRQNSARFEAAASMFNRSREMAMRVALIVAVSMGLDDVDEVAMRWAIDYVDFYAQRAVQSMADNMAEGETDALRKKVAAAIKSAGMNGLKMAELIKVVPGLGNLGKPQRDGLLSMVCEDFPIERAVSKPTGGGRPSIIHTWRID